ncbi:MAG TPA: hypothetical protein VN903_29610 [Polyangia bacterium]|jgi:hypothetical protein|nr:hypothetical protein [Polyangia bacterium]
MNALRRRLLKLGGLLGLFTVLWACNAPFIPVPPPGASFTSELVDDGAGGQKTVWITHGLPSANAANAYFYIINERTMNGVITVAGADGTYTAPALDGVMNDHVQITYSRPDGANYSDSICLLLTTEVSATGSAPTCPP